MKSLNKRCTLLVILCIAAIAVLSSLPGCSPKSKLIFLSISPASPHVPSGVTLQFTCIGTYADNHTEDITSSVKWISSDETAVTIDANGKATAQYVTTQRTATIVAEAQGLSERTTLTVLNLPLQSITIKPKNPAMATGTVLQLTAVGTYSEPDTPQDAYAGVVNVDVTKQVTWSSSHPEVVTIDSSGLVTAVDVNSSIISATLEGISSNEVTVTVSDGTLESITVNPDSPYITAGRSRQFTAIGNFSNGLHQDISPMVKWSSSNTDVAVINDSGFATVSSSATNYGTTTITATAQPSLGNVQGSTVLTPLEYFGR